MTPPRPAPVTRAADARRDEDEVRLDLGWLERYRARALSEGLSTDGLSEESRAQLDAFPGGALVGYDPSGS